MKSKYILISLFIIICCFLSIGCTTLGLNTQVQEVFLWKVTKGNHTSYLFGTMHAGVPINDMPGALLELIDQSNVIVTEIDGDEMEKLVKKDTFFPDEFFYSDGKKMRDYIGELQLKTLMTAIRSKYGEKIFSLDRLDSMTPYGFSLILEDALKPISTETFTYGEWLRYRPKFSLDYNIYLRARKKSIAVRHLESFESTLILKCMNQKGLNLIQATLKNGKFPEFPPDILQRMDRAYRLGQDSKIIEVLELQEQSGIPSSDNCLLNERNESWIHTIKTLIDSGEKSFFAVGVAHMLTSKKFEDGSLIQLLRKEGYKVERVYLSSL